MLDCKACGFLVTKEMLFSIRKNECPSCGKRLMDNGFISDVKTIKSKLSSSKILQEKSSEDLLNLLCIFIRNNFIENREETVTENIFEDIENKSLEDDDSKEIEVFEEPEASFEEIRDQVRSEYLQNSIPESETEEERVERLKLIARNSAMSRKMGTSVRRVSGD